MYSEVDSLFSFSSGSLVGDTKVVDFDFRFVLDLDFEGPASTLNKVNISQELTTLDEGPASLSGDSSDVWLSFLPGMSRVRIDDDDDGRGESMMEIRDRIFQGNRPKASSRAMICTLSRLPAIPKN